MQEVPYFRIKRSGGKYAALGISLAFLCAIVCILKGAVTQGLVFAAFFAIVSIFQIECNSKIANALNIIWCAFSGVVAVVLSQLLLNVGIASIAPLKLFLGVIAVEFIISLIFLLTMNYRTTVTTCLVIALALATVNRFVVMFRGSEFAPYDFLATATALNVAEKYAFEITMPMLYAYILGALYCYCGFAFPRVGVQRSLKKMVAGLSVSALLFFTFSLGTTNIKAQHFGQMGSFNNGYLLNFSLQFRNLRVKKPTEYSLEIIRELESDYSREDASNVRNVDVIVIMSEAFGDFSIFGEALSTNTEVLPFVSTLKENTIKGHALVSGIGGGTCNSEYEFLTSNSLGLLPTGCFPFQQYVASESYSVVTGFENFGFTTLGTHPANGENWMRTTVYPNFGFDEYYFVEHYPQEILLRGMISDKEMFRQLIWWYEHNSTSENQFIFAVTMQNHSPYDFTGVEFSDPVALNGFRQEYPDATQYLSLLNETDTAFEELVTYFKNIDRDVVIAVFGDHMPQLDSAFYAELHGGAFDTLEEQMLQYTVPFFIWANFDIEEKDVGLTSLNFLSNYVYEAACLPLPEYNAFLKDIQNIIPAMNAFGYYSKEKSAFIPYEEAEGKEAEALMLYRILQYNCLFDKENRSKVFFPTTTSRSQ